MARQHAGVINILLENEADSVDLRNNDGGTHLHTAARKGHEEVVRILLQSEAPTASQTKDGRTPLHEAAYYCNAEIVEQLQEYGAQPNSQDQMGRHHYTMPPVITTNKPSGYY